MELRFLKVEKIDAKGWLLYEGQWYNPKMFDIYMKQLEDDNS